ncbi:MAG: hypothetical protein KDK90_17475, partial [Leptospiraceae bacterium]|nr:hypothetical protein [Leptospiraceae bacterium]
MIPYFSLVFPVPFFISNNLLEIISAPIFIIFMVLLAPIIVFLFPKISRLLPESLDIWFNNTQKIILILWGAG